VISHASITNTPHSVLAREFSRVWGGRWHLTTSAFDTNVLIYRDEDGPVCVNTRRYWMWDEETLIGALWDAAKTLVPQQILDDIEYGSCVEAFIKCIDEDNPPPTRWDDAIPAWERHLYCPDCRQRVGGWKSVFGALAPEWWATMRERGIDPATGHKKSCRRRG
jgi:hypothetical protein